MIIREKSKFTFHKHSFPLKKYTLLSERVCVCVCVCVCERERERVLHEYWSLVTTKEQDKEMAATSDIEM
jgi:hypothetical protein